jgi:hypothetical protein
MPLALTRSSSSPTSAGKTELIAGLKRLEKAVARNTSGKAIHKASSEPTKSNPSMQAPRPRSAAIMSALRLPRSARTPENGKKRA